MLHYFFKTNLQNGCRLSNGSMWTGAQNISVEVVYAPLSSRFLGLLLSLLWFWKRWNRKMRKPRLLTVRCRSQVTYLIHRDLEQNICVFPGWAEHSKPWWGMLETLVISREVIYTQTRQKIKQLIKRIPVMKPQNKNVCFTKEKIAGTKNISNN